MKSPSGEPLAAAMGRLLVHERRSAFEAFGPTLVVAVPMHWSRALLAAPIARSFLRPQWEKAVGTCGVAWVGAAAADGPSERAFAGAPRRKTSPERFASDSAETFARAGIARRRRADYRFYRQRSSENGSPGRRGSRGSSSAGAATY